MTKPIVSKAILKLEESLLAILESIKSVMEVIRLQ